MNLLLPNRTEAGRLLASQLEAYANRADVLVLGLPRGGVPVAFEVAKVLQAPLDICLVRKLGVPKRKELAMGAIASGNVMVINDEVVDWLQISPETIEQVVATEQQELERRDRAYREGRPVPVVSNRTVILVDDGIATGSTLMAAIETLKQQQSKSIIVAVPVAPLSVYEKLKTVVDEVVCLITPESFRSISLWYEDFSQTTDEDVRYLLSGTFEQLNL